jgi:hypothetical protein
MKKLTIFIDNESCRYRRGSQVTGKVITSNQDIRGMLLVVSWFTEGKGDSDEGVVYESLLTSLPEEIETEGDRELSFQLVLPVWPVTYHGGILKIHWQIVIKIRGLVADSILKRLPFEVTL